MWTDWQEQMLAQNNWKRNTDLVAIPGRTANITCVFTTSQNLTIFLSDQFQNDGFWDSENDFHWCWPLGKTACWRTHLLNLAVSSQVAATQRHQLPASECRPHPHRWGCSLAWCPCGWSCIWHASSSAPPRPTSKGCPLLQLMTSNVHKFYKSEYFFSFPHVDS